MYSNRHPNARQQSQSNYQNRHPSNQHPNEFQILQQYCKELEKQRIIWYKQELEKANRRRPMESKNCWTANHVPLRISLGRYEGYFYDKDGIVTDRDYDYDKPLLNTDLFSLAREK